MSLQTYRVTGAYNSALVPGPLVQDDLLHIDEQLAERINADAKGTLVPAPDAAPHEAVNLQPGAILEERQRLLERDLGREPGVVTTLPHARRSRR